MIKNSTLWYLHNCPDVNTAILVHNRLNICTLVQLKWKHISNIYKYVS
jgi:hypothetical protein